MRGLVLAAMIALWPQPSQAQPPPPREAFTIRDVSVVDVKAGVVRTGRDVRVEDGVIVSVRRTGAPPKPGRVVEGAGRYLIPGLWDSHAHSLDASRWDWARKLTIANGITGFRDAATVRPLEEIARIKSDAEAGVIVSPRFVAAGPLIDGEPAIFEGFVTVRSPDEIRTVIADLDDRGADLIKVYTRLPREAFFAAAEEARNRGLPLSGHVPLTVTAIEALDAGMTIVDHAFRHRLDCAAEEAQIRRLLLQEVVVSTAGDWREADRIESEALRLGALTYSDEVCRALGARFRRAGAWFVPTLVEMRARFIPEVISDDASALEALFDDPRFAYYPRDIRERWMRDLFGRSGYIWGRTDYGGGDLQALRDLWSAERTARLRMVRALHEGGAPLLAGTDASFNFPLVFIAFSLHDELDLLVEAGLTPAEALRTATLNPALAFGFEGRLGEVAAGRRADLVLLDADPLESISAVRAVRAVVADGRYYDRAALDALLAEVRDANRGESP